MGDEHGQGRLHAWALFALLLVLSLAYALIPERPGSSTAVLDPIEPYTERFLAAAHWFGDGWAVNMWNTRLEQRAADDFQRILDDGFNAVVLLVPWSGFSSDPTSGELDQDRVQRLKALMRKADQMGLDVILRVSFAWDSMDSRVIDRLFGVWLDEDIYQGWLDHLEQLWREVGSEPNLKFGFFSWEDLWIVVDLAHTDLDQRLEFAKSSGFLDWLMETYMIERVGEFYRADFAEWSEVPVPGRREPAYELFMEFLDWALIEHFFVPARERFPRLSMEIRIDSDPIWDGDDLIKWFTHHRAWDLPGAQWTTLYWSPAMGGENQGEELSPQTAADRLASWLSEVNERTGPRRIFIGQFLAEDFTAGYAMNGRVPRHQVPEFLDLAADVLSAQADGYGLWTWVDYGHDAIANPEFVQGLDRWQASPDVAIRDGRVEIPARSSIGTEISIHDYHAPGGPQKAEMCATGAATDTDTTHVTVYDQAGEEMLGALRFDNEESEQCFEFEVAGHMHLALVPEDDVVISRVTSVGFVQVSGMRERDFSLKTVGEGYQRMNTALGNKRLPKQPLYGDGWMGGHLLTYLAYRDDRDALVLSTHLPDDWPEAPELNIMVNDMLVAQVPCVAEGEYRLALSPTVIRDRSFASVYITASSTHSPKPDVRELGCQIVRLELGSAEVGDGRNRLPSATIEWEYLSDTGLTENEAY